MNGPSIVLTDDDESEIEVSPMRPSAFQIPSRSPVGMANDMLINKRKVSGDVISMSSGSVSSGSDSGSVASESGTEETRSGAAAARTMAALRPTATTAAAASVNRQTWRSAWPPSARAWRRS